MGGWGQEKETFSLFPMKEPPQRALCSSEIKGELGYREADRGQRGPLSRALLPPLQCIYSVGEGFRGFCPGPGERCQRPCLATCRQRHKGGEERGKQVERKGWEEKRRGGSKGHWWVGGWLWGETVLQSLDISKFRHS